MGACLEIKCDGITSLSQDKLGGEMSSLDMSHAYRNNVFGDNPKIWGDTEWPLLRDYLSGGIAHSQGDWEALTWQPQVWNTEAMIESQATKSRQGLIRELAARAKNADGYLTHMCSIVPFMAGDALPTIAESTAFDLSPIPISEPTRLRRIPYAVCS